MLHLYRKENQVCDYLLQGLKSIVLKRTHWLFRRLKLKHSQLCDKQAISIFDHFWWSKLKFAFIITWSSFSDSD